MQASKGVFTPPPAFSPALPQARRSLDSNMDCFSDEEATPSDISSASEEETTTQQKQVVSDKELRFSQTPAVSTSHQRCFRCLDPGHTFSDCPVHPCERCSGEHATKDCPVQNRCRGCLVYVQHSESNPCEGIECDKCGKRHHACVRCQQEGICQLCDQPGHMAKQCPKLSPAKDLDPSQNVEVAKRALQSQYLRLKRI